MRKASEARKNDRQNFLPFRNVQQLLVVDAKSPAILAHFLCIWIAVEMTIELCKGRSEYSILSYTYCQSLP